VRIPAPPLFNCSINDLQSHSFCCPRNVPWADIDWVRQPYRRHTPTSRLPIFHGRVTALQRSLAEWSCWPNRKNARSERNLTGRLDCSNRCCGLYDTAARRSIRSGARIAPQPSGSASRNQPEVDAGFFAPSPARRISKDAFPGTSLRDHHPQHRHSTRLIVGPCCPSSLLNPSRVIRCRRPVRSRFGPRRTRC
jgi:hypothetical protein